VRNRTLHDHLRAFAENAGECLNATVEGGIEIPFEVTERPGQTSVLYSYSPLSDRFVRERFGELRRIDGFGPALLALSKIDGLSAYLRVLGQSYVPTSERDRAETALREFLARVWQETSSFALDQSRFEQAYRELESIVYENTVVNTVLAPLPGVRLEDDRWDVGSGIELVRGDLCDAPAEAIWSPGQEEREPSTIALMTVETTPKDPPPLASARLEFRKLLTTLRLLKAGGAALGATGWWRLDDGPWQKLPLGYGGRPRAGGYTLEPADRGELSELFELVRHRPLAGGSLPWALARFEMGCERGFALEGLSDHLLAVRALLDGDEPSPVGLSTRLAALCAEPADRGSLETRVVQALELERLAMRGELDARALRAIGADSADAVALELELHLRALLRDMVCGYLDVDVKRIADDLLRAESAQKPEPRIEVRRTSVAKPKRKEPVIERWEEVVPARSGRPSVAAPPEPEFAGDRPRRGPAKRADSEQATEETDAVAVGAFDWHREDDVDDWGFDDDPSDFSAAV
jgi:hypothetical protein